MELTLNQLLYRVAHEKDRILQPARDRLGLGRGQPRVIAYLGKHGPASQSDIAQHLGIDPAAVSRMVETLRSNGFLTRSADDLCRRANRLELTAKGAKAAEEWERECSDVEKRLLAGFTGSEVDLLRGLLKRLLRNMGQEVEG